MSQQRRGDEDIMFGGKPIGYQLRDYWAWDLSDLLNNTKRGSFCEFIVSSAIGVDLSGTNDDWAPYDILMEPNIRIEVKSAAYLQSWNVDKISNIQFTIRPTKAWESDTGYSDEAKRQSDVYVFCLYTEKDRSKADPLNLDGWDFYVLATKTLNEVCGAQKTITFRRLLELAPIKTDYSGIRSAILSVFS